MKVDVFPSRLEIVPFAISLSNAFRGPHSTFIDQSIKLMLMVPVFLSSAFIPSDGLCTVMSISGGGVSMTLTVVLSKAMCFGLALSVTTRVMLYTPISL